MLRDRRKGKEMYFDQVEFGRRIKRERIKMKVTQEELAVQMNISHNHMNRIETGREGCSIDLLLELAELFEVSTDYLLTGRHPSNEIVKRQLQGVVEHLEDILQKMDC